MANLGDLLQAAEQLTTEIEEDSSELPRVKRNLKQLVEAGQQLYSKTNRCGGDETSQQDIVKASILLGSKGVDLPGISRRLDALSSSTAAFEPVEPIRETDIAGFLRNERENAILSLIEETRTETFKTVDKLHWDSMAIEWEADKQRILNALVGSGGPASDLTDLIRNTTESSRIHDSTLGTRSALDTTERLYAREVTDYNGSVTAGGLKPDLVSKFSALFPEDKDQEIGVIWAMVRAMSKSKERSAVTVVGNAKRYLETAFKTFVRNTVFNDLQRAELGGVPSVLNMVRSFLNVKMIDAGLEDGQIWPLIYYCMRCGDIDAANQAAKSAGLQEVSKLLCEIAASADHRLSPQSENAVRLSYRRSVRQQTTDPFKRAVFCLLGACDPSEEHPEVATSLDDYLWIKLSQIREDDHDEAFSLRRLQTLMAEDYGETYFSAFEQPLLYFQVLFLTGQFEAAVEFLFRVDRLRPHGVHVALALYESGLLLLPATIQAPILSSTSTKAEKRLNLARLVILYVRKFEFSDPKEALQYFYFLRSLKSASDNLFTSCVSELVLESLEFDRLLGSMNPDGTRTTGLLDGFNNHLDTQKIIENVASDSERKGMFETSVKLYDLAGKHEKVIELLNKLLAQVISQPPVSESRRERLQRSAVEIAKRYRAVGHTASRESMVTFFLLLDLMTFFDLYHAKKFEDAIDAVSKIRVIPFMQDDVDYTVSNFRMMSDEVRRNLPDLLLAVMNILFSQYKQSKAKVMSSPSSIINISDVDGGREKQLETLRERAKCIITFAGIIPYRMPGDTNARLVQMEVLMN